MNLLCKGVKLLQAWQRFTELARPILDRGVRRATHGQNGGHSRLVRHARGPFVLRADLRKGGE